MNMQKLRNGLFYLSLVIFSLVKFLAWAMAFSAIVVSETRTSKESQLAVLLLASLATGWLVACARRRFWPVAISSGLAASLAYFLAGSPVLVVVLTGLNLAVWGYLFIELRKFSRRYTRPSVNSLEEWSARYETSLSEPRSARYLLDTPGGSSLS